MAFLHRGKNGIGEGSSSEEVRFHVGSQHLNRRLIETNLRPFSGVGDDHVDVAPFFENRRDRLLDSPLIGHVHHPDESLAPGGRYLSGDGPELLAPSGEQGEPVPPGTQSDSRGSSDPG